MSNYYAGRSESYLYQVLDNRDNIIGTLDGVIDGKVDCSSSATVRGSGSITVRTSDSLDLLNNRIRVSYVWEGWIFPLITALPSIPSEQYGLGRQLSIGLKDKLSILDGDSFGYSYSIEQGVNIIDAVHAVLLSANQTAVIEASSAVSTGRVWEPNDSKLKIINDLLDAANYFALYTDGLGQLQADKYIEPNSRPVMWTFEDTPGKGTYLPDFVRNYDPYSIPNSYVCIGKTDGDAEADRAQVLDYDSPYGFNARGYWLTKVDTEVEGNLNDIANRRLIDSRNVYETLEIEHPYLPFSINGHENRVSFINDGKTWNAVCQRQSFSLKEGGLIKSTLRIIV